MHFRNLNIFFLIPLLFLFLPALCIPLGFKNVVVYYLTLISAFTLYSLLNYKKVVRKILFLYKNTPFKYFIYFIGWFIISSIILILKGTYSISVFLYYLGALVFVDYMLTYLLPIFIYNPKFGIHFLMKFLLIIYYSIFILGLIEFIGKAFNISPLTEIIYIIANQRFLENNDLASFGIADRVCSVFAEPSWFGSFIFINMPIIFKLALSKYSIFKTPILNIVLKRTIIPLMYINILIIQSAIWLVFCIILTIILFKNNIGRYIKKYKIPIFLIFLIFIFVSLYINCMFEYKGNYGNFGYYSRIFTFFNHLNSINLIIEEIPSLGTRLVSYKATILIAKDNFLLGIGLGNLQYLIAPVLFNLDITTGETLAHLQCFYTMSNKMDYNGAILYQYIAELGVIGLLLFYLFIYKSVKFLSKIQNYYSGLALDFLLGVKQSVITISCILFYEITETYYYIWFIFGLVNVFLFEYYFINRSIKRNDNN